MLRITVIWRREEKTESQLWVIALLNRYFSCYKMFPIGITLKWLFRSLSHKLCNSKKQCGQWSSSVNGTHVTNKNADDYGYVYIGVHGVHYSWFGPCIKLQLPVFRNVLFNYWHLTGQYRPPLLLLHRWKGRGEPVISYIYIYL